MCAFKEQLLYVGLELKLCDSVKKISLSEAQAPQEYNQSVLAITSRCLLQSFLEQVTQYVTASWLVSPFLVQMSHRELSPSAVYDGNLSIGVVNTLLKKTKKWHTIYVRTYKFINYIN